MEKNLEKTRNSLLVVRVIFDDQVKEVVNISLKIQDKQL